MARKDLTSKGNKDSGRGDYTGKIMKHRFQKIGGVLFVLIMLIAIVVLCYIAHVNKIYTESEVVDVYQREVASEAYTTMLGSNILTYSNDGASCMDTKGKQVWNETYEMQNPIVSINGTAVAIADYNGRAIYMMNTEGSLGKVTTNLPIRSISVSENGYVAAVLDDTDVTWINLYSSSGEEAVTMKTTMSQSGYPAAIALSPDSTLLAVSYLSPQDGAVKSSIAFYNFGEVGQNEIDNYMSGYDYQAVAPLVKFMNKQLSFAMADDRIMFYEGAQKPISKAEIFLEEEVQSVYYNDSYVALISYDTTGSNMYVMKLYDSDGNLKLEYPFDLPYKNIIIKKDLIYIYSDTTCVIVNSAGVEKFSGEMTESIYLLIPGDTVSKFSMVGSRDIKNIKLG